MAPASGFPRSFGKYTLLSHLAVGGMADVFLAQQKGPAGFEKECVIKRILPNLALDQGFVHMFLDEARIAARLSHPNIVQIFDLGQEGGDFYLALEYINGITLEKIVDTLLLNGQKTLPWPIAVRIVANIAEGLDHAHKATDSAGNPLMLVHRDVSPSNIMVSWDGVAKILDFGIAKAAQSGKVKTEVGIIKGKVPYMSPEQLQGLELDGRADVFSLGAILYEITCGQRPFLGDSMGQLTVQIMGRDPIDPLELNPAFPPDLQPIVWRALAKTTTERFQSAREFKVALEQFLADQHVACTHYDVEAYLRELIPEAQRPPHPLQVAEAALAATEHGLPSPVGQSLPPGLIVSQSGQNPVARSDGKGSPSRPPRDPLMTSSPSNSASSLDRSDSDGRLPALRAAHTDLDLDAEEQRQKRKGGGGGVITLAIVSIVLITAVVFYVLHERAVSKTPETSKPEGQTATAPGVSGPAKDPAAPTGEAKPATPAPGEAKAPEKPAEKPAEKATAKAADKPADKTADKPADKTADKPGRRHRDKEETDEAPRALPRLPVPPPTDGE